MCQKNLKNLSDKDLLLELYERGLLTKSKSNDTLITEINSVENFQLIITRGITEKNLECRECKKTLPSGKFSYYLSRVDKDGFLMRSNALCEKCKIKTNEPRKKVLKNVDKKTKPKKGDSCIKCERIWFGRWHRHHVGDSFVGWWCGECNMRHADQRNKKTKK